MKIAGTAGGICPYVGGLQSVYFLEAYKGGAVMLKEMLALSDKGARDFKKRYRCDSSGASLCHAACFLADDCDNGVD